MNWYEKLADYFPEEEMKPEGQMVELLEANTPYHKLETNEYVVTYADFPAFLFIDYLLVTATCRSRGVGSQLLNRFKRQGKTIILEVEPPDADDGDSLKRIRFYRKNDFRKAEHILYTLSDGAGEEYVMDVYYWSPTPVSELKIMDEIAVICREIHNFKAQKYYGRLIANPAEHVAWES